MKKQAVVDVDQHLVRAVDGALPGGAARIGRYRVRVHPRGGFRDPFGSGWPEPGGEFLHDVDDPNGVRAAVRPPHGGPLCPGLPLRIGHSR